jgi:hypothetical protein
MKKNLLITVLLVLFGFGAMAQQDNAISIGIRGGVNMPRMLYFNNMYLSSLPQGAYFTPTGGLFVDIPLNDIVVIAPEVDYVQRGTSISYQHISSTFVNYSLAIKYVDLHVPFEFRIPIKPYLQPFFQVGAEGGWRLGGHIHIDRTMPALFEADIEIGDANMTKVYAGVFAGLGIRSLVTIGQRDFLFKIGASYHQGIIDTYTAREKEEDVPAENVNAYHITGSRLPRGIELYVSFGIPLKPRPDDACRTFSNDRYRRRGTGRGLFGF